MEVNEGTPLNVTCNVTSAKPAAEIRWYLNGQRLTDGVSNASSKNSNHTENTFSTVELKPRYCSRSLASMCLNFSKNDHNKILTCEGVHPQSSTEKRAKVALNVLCTSIVLLACCSNK